MPCSSLLLAPSPAWKRPLCCCLWGLLGPLSTLLLTDLAAPPLWREEDFRDLKKVKWKDIKEALNVEQLGKDEQRGQGEEGRCAGRGTVGDRGKG